MLGHYEYAPPPRSPCLRVTGLLRFFRETLPRSSTKRRQACPLHPQAREKRERRFYGSDGSPRIAPWTGDPPRTSSSSEREWNGLGEPMLPEAVPSISRAAATCSPPT